MHSWFERYVNFEFYKTYATEQTRVNMFERYVNFEFYKTQEITQQIQLKFERYVNFEFYKTFVSHMSSVYSLRDM